MTREDRAKLVDQLIRHEGMRLFPYQDTAGKTTIGVGRNLTDVGLTHAEAMTLLNNDIDRTLMDLIKAQPWVTDLDPVRLRVLVDMGFNLGVPGLLQFKHTLESVRQKNFKQAAHEMLQSRWAEQVGGRAQELARMMETGELV